MDDFVKHDYFVLFVICINYLHSCNVLALALWYIHFAVHLVHSPIPPICMTLLLYILQLTYTSVFNMSIFSLSTTKIPPVANYTIKRPYSCFRGFVTIILQIFFFQITPLQVSVIMKLLFLISFPLLFLTTSSILSNEVTFQLLVLHKIL